MHRPRYLEERRTVRHIHSRLRRLEATGEACPECYLKPKTPHVVYPGEQAPEPPVCPSCGRSLGLVVRVVYDGAEGGGA